LHQLENILDFTLSYFFSSGSIFLNKRRLTASYFADRKEEMLAAVATVGI